MAILLSNGKILRIIDRTLPEFSFNKNNISELEISRFCNLLKSMGVDFFEIDSQMLREIRELPAEMDVILRLRTEYDAEECIRRGIKYCVVKWTKLLNPYFYNILTKGNLNVTVEYEADCLSDLYRLKRLLELNKIVNTGSIRVTGLDRLTDGSWIGFVRKIGRKYKLNIDVCPENTYSIATSVAVEGVMGGVETITLSFMGYGRGNGFAALEEVLMAIKVMMSVNGMNGLDMLPESSALFTHISGIIVPGNKPVIGSDIFKYESGIHADGIEKDPSTYEPFNPGEVGLERKLVIGKHSGKKSVTRKLRELGHECNNNELYYLLRRIRTKSIELKRDLNDYEIRDILIESKAV